MRRQYETPVSRTGWYLKNSRYRSYMLRELTCLLVAVYCVLMLVALHALAQDQPDRWNALLAAQRHPGWLIFHAAALVFFTCYQTAAWFRLAPKAMPLQLGTKPLPASSIVFAHYVLWVAVSAALFWLTGAFGV